MDVKTETTIKTGKAIHQIAFGVLLVLLGGLLISAHTGLIPHNFNRIILSWQMLLIAIGILSLFKRHPFSGMCCILIGGFFIIPRLAEVFPDAFPWVNENFVSGYWAGLLMGAGILIIIYWLVAPRKRWHEGNTIFHHRHHRNRYCREKRQDEINGDFSKSHLFSSGEYIVLEPEFKGGEINVVFGATEIDLRKTSLPEGDTYLDIRVIFGGVVLFIPDDWKVETKVKCTFSGIADKRRVFEPTNPSRKLILTGECIFSGCEIKN
jgi:predicted membrane protein